MCCGSSRGEPAGGQGQLNNSSLWAHSSDRGEVCKGCKPISSEGRGEMSSPSPAHSSAFAAHTLYQVERPQHDVQSVHLQLDQLLPVDFHLHTVTEQFQEHLTRKAVKPTGQLTVGVGTGRRGMS